MAAHRLDVSDVTCPLTWVRTKLALERLGPGEELVVLCPPGEALENVPRSAAEAGHRVTVDGAVVRIVRRGAIARDKLDLRTAELSQKRQQRPRPD